MINLLPTVGTDESIVTIATVKTKEFTRYRFCYFHNIDKTIINLLSTVGTDESIVTVATVLSLTQQTLFIL
jgi:hypothetical protein